MYLSGSLLPLATSFHCCFPVESLGCLWGAKDGAFNSFLPQSYESPVSGQPPNRLGQFGPGCIIPNSSYKSCLCRDHVWGCTVEASMHPGWEMTVGHLSPVQCLDSLLDIPECKGLPASLQHIQEWRESSWLSLIAFGQLLQPHPFHLFLLEHILMVLAHTT